MQARQRRRRRRRRVRQPVQDDAKSNVPISYARKSRAQAPRLRQTSARTTSIHHKETLGEIKCQADFTVNTYIINPGVEAVFPWLSQQAGSWEYYRFSNLRVTYEPLVSTTYTGLVMLAYEYAAGSSPPPDLKTIMSYSDARSSPVYRSCSAPLEIGAAFPAGGFKYVRHVQVPTDRKLYDAAVLMVATGSGVNPAYACGILSIEYDVIFKTPQVEKPIALVAGVASANKGVAQTVVSTGTTGSISSNFAATPMAYNTIPGIEVVALSDGGTGFILPAGTYRVTADMQLRSDAAGASAGWEEVSVTLQTTADNGATYHPLTNPSTSVQSAEAPVSPAGFRYYNIVNDAIIFLEQATTFAVGLAALVTASITSGAVTVRQGSTLNFRQLGAATAAAAA